VAIVTMKALLETGVHFGHRRRRWNPKMKPYIFTERNGIHIIDLQQTAVALEKAYNLVRDVVAEGGTLLFVGTKRQAQEAIAEHALRCGMPYVNKRWLGGTLTNWRTIRQRIDHLKHLEGRRDQGGFDLLLKKEALKLNQEIIKLEDRLGGIKEMRDLPDLLFVTDVRREYIAVSEANKLNIPVIAMVDTNCDPDPIDHIIPANDDAIRANRLLISKMADAVLEGIALRKAAQPEEIEEKELFEDEDERYLGEATLAKIRAAMVDADDEAQEVDDETAETSETTEGLETVDIKQEE
jgi:small subunit ribosomal protein S2